MKPTFPDNAVLATPSDLVVVYAGPFGGDLIPLELMGFAYSYDFTVEAYRWTMQRPIAERCPRLLEKLISTMPYFDEDRFFLGLVFNGKGDAKPPPEVRGLHFPNVRKIHAGMSVSQSGLIVDVATGLCDEPKPWVGCPEKLTRAPEFR